MTIQEIKTAIASGHNVHWISLLYKVVTGFEDQLYIECLSNGNRIGIESDNGQMINALPTDFFIPSNS